MYTMLSVANKEQHNNGKNGVRMTKILYGAYLSYTQVKDYVTYLLENGLLKGVESPLHEKRYFITEKGLKFLDLCNQMGEIIPELRR